jgi:L-cysteine/cystine lyase
VLERFAYLNAGTVGPLARRTVAVMAEMERDGLENGRGSRASFVYRFELRARLRDRLAALLSTSSDKLALTCSTTEGCHLVLTGLGLRPEDEVVTTDAEHPALLGPLASLGVRVRAAAVLGRPQEAALEAILAMVSARTRLIAVSHVLLLNGQVLPIAEIKRRSGLPLLVDGAQAVGAIPVDAEIADFYTVSGQKWLCGPELTGAVYVAQPDRLVPRIAVSESPGPFPRAGAATLEMAFHPAPAIGGLLAAIEDMPEDALESNAAITNLCREALLSAGARVMSEPGQGTLVAFRVPGDPGAVVDHCQRGGVVIRALPNGWLRASCGWWNSARDMERLVDALSSFRAG